MLDKIFSIILCIISATIYYSASNFDMSYIGDTGLGPDFFPKIISIILIVLSILIFISKDNKKREKNTNIKYTLMTILIFALYIILIGKIGYLVSTIFFSFMIISLLKKNSIILKVVYSIIFPVGLYLLFTYAFKVSLPTGVFI